MLLCQKRGTQKPLRKPASRAVSASGDQGRDCGTPAQAPQGVLYGRSLGTLPIRRSGSRSVRNLE
jgi:hypothetical protein